MTIFGITAKNHEQKEAIRVLLNEKPFTFLTGPAGSGKTLLAQAAGLERLTERQDYRKFMYTRLQTQLGMDVGALPGSIDEKTYPFVAPFMDNLEIMSEKSSEIKRYLTEGEDDKRKVFFETIQTMRGRSLHHTFLLVDEVQNIDVHTFAAIATRISEGSKFVFVGNFAQIDSAKLRKPSANGLFKLLEGMYGKDAHEYYDHINLTIVERHPVVGIVEDILRNHEVAPEFEALETRGNVSN